MQLHAFCDTCMCAKCTMIMIDCTGLQHAIHIAILGKYFCCQNMHMQLGIHENFKRNVQSNNCKVRSSENMHACVTHFHICKISDRMNIRKGNNQLQATYIHCQVEYIKKLTENCPHRRSSSWKQPGSSGSLDKVPASSTCGRVHSRPYALSQQPVEMEIL